MNICIAARPKYFVEVGFVLNSSRIVLDSFVQSLGNFQDEGWDHRCQLVKT